MSNINRDYLIILDVKSGEVDSPNIYYFNTDKNTSNLYVQMVLRETSVEVTPIENAAEYSIKANILKPNMVAKEVEGTLVNPEKAIYEFTLPADCTDFSGNAKIEFEVYTGNKIATSFATKFKVHGSVLTEQNKYIEDSSDYPILKTLMAEVKVINETAHELDTTIRTLQSDMIEANEEMKTNEVTRQANETTRVANEEARKEAERTRVNQEAAREEAEATREANEQQRIANENVRKTAENTRVANESVRASNEVERKSAEASRVSAENTRAANEATRQTNEANRETAEAIRKANEEARIAEHEAMRTEHEQTMTAVNEVKAENAVLMENDKKLADRMTQVEISDKRQYVIMEGLMNSAGDGYLKIEDTGNDTTLYNSVEGFVDVKNITGNTMVNSIKNSDDEFTLNADINTSGQSVTLTTAVDNGQVDVLAEGNTMVNVCDQREAVAITKSYTVETGNHIALQGEFDGKARPVVTGNTLVNLSQINEATLVSNSTYTTDLSMIKTNTTYTRIINVITNNLSPANDGGKVAGIDESHITGNVSASARTIDSGFTGIIKFTFTSPSDLSGYDKCEQIRVFSTCTEGQLVIKDILLEGDYTNKPIPDYFTGMQSSFEDKLVPENLSDIPNVETETVIGGKAWTTTNLIPAGEYTFIFTGKTSNPTDKRIQIGVADTPYIDKQSNLGSYLYTYTNINSEYSTYAIKITLSESKYVGIRLVGAGGCFKDVYLVEEDYTNYDFSDYDPTKAGKYRVDYKVTGKNKFDGELVKGYWYNASIINDNNAVANKNNILVKPNMTYTISIENYAGKIYMAELDSQIKEIKSFVRKSGENITTSASTKYLRFCTDKGILLDVNVHIQLEEGSTTTPYEPYKESIKTYYLNSPLLEGDTIEESNGNVYHVHRYGKVVLDGSSDENWNMINTKTYWTRPSNGKNNGKTIYCTTNSLCSNVVLDFQGNLLLGLYSEIENIAKLRECLNSNPVTVVYELASPTYELISQSDTILTDSYVSGHLDFDTAVPVERVAFNTWGQSLRYIYPDTNYVVQFDSDNVGKIDAIYTTKKVCLENLDVVKGVNKFTFTTGNAFDSNWFTIHGIGFSASNIVVTEATDKDFGYFSGMKSVGELEENKIEILSSTGNLYKRLEDSYYKIYGSLVTIIQDDENGLIYTSDGWDMGVSYLISTDGMFKNKEYVITWDKIAGTDGIPVLHSESGITLLDSDKNVKCIIKHYEKSERLQYVFKMPDNLEQGDILEVRLKNGALSRTQGAYNFRINEGTTIQPYIESKLNKKQILLNEPLRAVGDTKDRFVKVGNKWFIERNVTELVIDGENNMVTSIATLDNTIRMSVSINSIQAKSSCDGICYEIPYIRNNSEDIEHIRINGSVPYGNMICWINKNKIPNISNKEDCNNYLKSNNIHSIVELASPTYEPVEIAPTLNTYTDVTHITNNSTIPMNMPIVNSGYEVIAKPSTKYTVVGITNGRIGDSTIVNGTITTPATLDDPFLRPYGTGKTSKVMLLEGEPANIPSYFKGIKSVFEDKVTEDGKYEVEVKVVGKNKFDGKIIKGGLNAKDGTYNGTLVNSFICSSNFTRVTPNTTYIGSDMGNYPAIFEYDANFNYIKYVAGKNFTTSANTHYIKWHIQTTDMNILVQIEEGTVASEYEPYHETKQTLYLDEPLYNTNNITIYNDKLGYWKKWDKVVLDGSENWAMPINQGRDKTICFTKDSLNANFNLDTLCAINDKVPYGSFNDIIEAKDIEGLGLGYDNIFFAIGKNKLPTQDVAGVKQYLSQNPTTVVYQLAEPVFVPLIDNCPNWVIGSWDNCSIHFDSIIPLKDTRYRYTGNVPSVMTMSNDVATVSDISDQQDSMIIDLATQVATMEMMLM